MLLDNNQIRPARSEGKKVLTDYKKFESRLTTPIISPILEYILTRFEKLEYIVLFVTNQEPPNQNDTLYFGEIIELILEKRENIKNIKLIQIPHNPALYDEMFNYYEKKINYRTNEWEKVFISPTGGTPACNFALLFNTVKFFQEKCEILYTSEKTKKVIPLHIVTPLLNEFKKNVIKTLVRNYDYSAISDILENNNEWRIAHLLSEYARLRLYFDFDSALHISEELIKITQGKLRKFCEDLRENLDKFAQEDKKALMLELYNNAKIKAKRKEYVDFLGRIFRLQEALLRYVVEMELQIPTDVSSTEKREKYRHAIKGQIEDFLKTLKVGGKLLRYEEPNTMALLNLIKFIVEEKGQEKYRTFYEKIEKTQRLARLRDRSIMAHGFEEISEKKLEEKNYPLKEIIEDFSKILNDIDIEAGGETVFDEINNKILDNL